MNDKKSDKITVEEAIRLKNKLNQDISYGGLNAKQVEELADLTQEQYSEISRQLNEIKKSWWFFPSYFWIVGLLGGGFCMFYFDKLLVQGIALVLMLCCIAQLSYRSGLKYGYIRGYESGHEGGVHKAIGLSREDLSEIRERAVEMEIDERLIKKLDERTKE